MKLMSSITEAKMLNPFIEACISVMNDFTDLEVQNKDTEATESPKPSFGYAIILGIVGDIEGQVCYSLETTCAKRLVSGFLGTDEDDPQVEEYLSSGLEEMSNMMAGNASKILAEDGVEIDISPPSIVEGKDYDIQFVKMKTIQVTLSTNCGPMEINLALSE